MRKGYTLSVNLDFDSYLDIDTVKERTNLQYKALWDYQKALLKEETSHCEILRGSNAPTFDAANITDEVPNLQEYCVVPWLHCPFSYDAP